MKLCLAIGGIAGLVLAGAVRAQASGDAARGEGLFEERCASCHVAQGGGQGPSLVGVVGRLSATVPGLIYSKALQNAHVTWTPSELDRFLTNPAAAIPGTAMPLAVPNAKDRADLIAYLGSGANKP